MEEIRLWNINGDGTAKPAAAPVEAIAEATTEKLIEDVLTKSPDALMPKLRLVGRQTETPGGPLDLLRIDEDGNLVVFELKRGKLTRDAVVQAIDYASYLANLEPAKRRQEYRTAVSRLPQSGACGRSCPRRSPWAGQRILGGQTEIRRSGGKPDVFAWAR